MKVLFLTPWYPHDRNPNHGIFVRDQVRAVGVHHEVTVISASIDYQTGIGLFSSRLIETESEGIKEYRIWVKRSFPVFNQLNFFIVIFIVTLKIARKFRPDIIHGNIGYPGAFWSWMVSKAMNVPYIITEHTSRFANNFRSSIHKYLTIKFLSKAKQIISVSEHSANEVASFVGVKPLVIPNIIDFSKFTALASVSQGDVWHIGFLGGLSTTTKGLDVLLQAIVDMRGNFMLHIGGAGELVEDYKVMATALGVADRCIFYGFVRHDQVPEFMSRLHFFVSASRYESFGMVMVEAMACGLPVVATNSGGPQDFITPENGILVDKENPEKLRGAIEKMMKTYDQYDHQAIRKFVIEKYSVNKILKEILEIYPAVIREK